MSALRRREWVALILFGFSLVVAATFVDATAGSSDIAPRTPVLGEPIVDDGASSPGSIPTPTATLEATRAHVMAPDDTTWLVLYFTDSLNRFEREMTHSFLHIEMDATPFDLVDGDWRLEARAAFDLQPGDHAFTIEYIASVTVLVDGVEVATGSYSPQPRRLTAVFHHAGGPAEVRIDAKAEAGAFLLSWR